MPLKILIVLAMVNCDLRHGEAWKVSTSAGCKASMVGQVCLWEGLLASWSGVTGWGKWCYRLSFHQRWIGKASLLMVVWRVHCCMNLRAWELEHKVGEMKETKHFPSLFYLSLISGYQIKMQPGIFSNQPQRHTALTTALQQERGWLIARDWGAGAHPEPHRFTGPLFSIISCSTDCRTVTGRGKVAMQHQQCAWAAGSHRLLHWWPWAGQCLPVSLCPYSAQLSACWWKGSILQRSCSRPFL